jgi:DNA-binding HxlR family transcriptional regulator
VRLTLDVVGGKWKAHILWELRTGARRTLRPSLEALARWAKMHHEELGAPLDWPTRVPAATDM